MEKRFEERNNFYYFDLLFDQEFKYDDFLDINIHEAETAGNTYLLFKFH